MNITRVQMRTPAKLVSTTMAGIEMIETIKASGAENGFFRKWAGYQSSVNTQMIKFTLTLNQIFGMIPQFISSISNYVGTVHRSIARNERSLYDRYDHARSGLLLSFMTPAMTHSRCGTDDTGDEDVRWKV